MRGGSWGVGILGLAFLLVCSLGAQEPKETKETKEPKEEKGLVLKLEVRQRSFIVGKPMAVRFTIENTGKEPIDVEIPERYTTGLTLNGNPLEPPKKEEGEKTPPPEKAKRTLKSGDFFGTVVDISALVTAATKEDGMASVKWSHAGKESNELRIPIMKEYQAEIETNYGTVTVEFYPEEAPNHVLNFITLARKGFYDRKIFHRIIKGFMMQGGCPNGNGMGGTGKMLNAEFNWRKHLPGTLSMARTQDPNSADCQFFICFTDQPRLDGMYTVFGQVVNGMDVVKKIELVKTDHPEGVAFNSPMAGCGSQHLDKPVQDVVMKKVTIVEKKGGEQK